VKASRAELFDELGEMPAIGDQGGAHAGLACGGHQFGNLPVHQGFAPLKVYIPDAAPVQERQRPGKPGSIDPALFANNILITRE
jgi:hypothetical protein